MAIRGPRRAVLIVAVVVVAVGAMLVKLKLDADRRYEWEHGGDGFRPVVQVLLGEPGKDLDAYGDTMYVEGSDYRAQAIAVRIQWHGQPDYGPDWYYGLLALDSRVTPPRPLTVNGGRSHDGADGMSWGGSYEALAEHYPWLARTASVQAEDGTWRNDMMAVHAAADADGWMTATWYVSKDYLPITDVDQLMIAVFLTHDGEVRWATKLSLRRPDGA